MLRKKRTIAIIIMVLIVTSGGYTIVSNSTEPHLPSLSVTGISFSEKIINKTHSPFSSRYTGGSVSTLFFHNFTLYGDSATYGFSLNSFDFTTFSYGNLHPFSVLITKTNQSSKLPYFGSFFLKVINSNITTLVDVNGSEIYNSGVTESGTMVPLNTSVIEYHLSYTPKVPFTIINKTFATENGIKYATNYSLTYSLELVPIFEAGPYYAIGHKIWISHTFKYPFSNLTL